MKTLLLVMRTNHNRTDKFSYVQMCKITSVISVVCKCTEITEVIISMIATSLSGMTGSDDVDEVASCHLTSAGETMAGTYQ